MLPLTDENAGTILKPYVTWTLMGLCLLVFLYEFFLPMRPLVAFIFMYGAIPVEITHAQDLFTLVTSMFLHLSWLHLAGNMLYLHIFGNNIEDAMGHIRYLLFYLLTGVAAALAHSALAPGSPYPMIGASGAISGVMGAYIVLFPHGKVGVLIFIRKVDLPAWSVIGFWFALQLYFAYLSLGRTGGGGVAFGAHVGGFIAGAVLVLLFRDRVAVARQRAKLRGYTTENMSWGQRWRGGHQ